MTALRHIFFLTILVASTVLAPAGDVPNSVVAEMNLARTKPQSYAQILQQTMGGPRTNSRDVDEAVRFLQKAKPLPPLAMSTGMSRGAKLHVDDIGPKGGTGHYGSGRSTPWSRISRYGQWLGTAGENIYYGQRDARGIVCALIVDSSVRSRGHRKNIFNRSFNVTGVASGMHATYGSMCVMDFAGQYLERSASVAGL